MTLYKFVNQQLDLVSNTKDSFFVYEVAKESTMVIYEFQKAQKEMLQTNSKELAMKYLLAIVNNNAKAYDYTEEYEFRVRGFLSEPELSRFEKEEKQALVDGFEDVRKLAVSCIVAQIFDLFRESNVLSKLFGKEWQRGVGRDGDEYGPMEVVVQTLADVERDRRLVEQALGPLVQGKSFLARRLNLLSGIATFLATPMDDQGQFILTYNALLDDYPDLTPDLVKRIVGSRVDCDKNALAEVIAACRGILPSDKQLKPFFDIIK